MWYYLDEKNSLHYELFKFYLPTEFKHIQEKYIPWYRCWLLYWVITPWRLERRYQRSAGMRCFCLQKTMFNKLYIVLIHKSTIQIFIALEISELMNTFLKFVLKWRSVSSSSEASTAEIMNSYGLLSHVIDRLKVNRRFGGRKQKKK
jgi:hypothetical protein